MKHKNLVKLTLMALSSLPSLCTGVVSPALPLIQKDLEANGFTNIGFVVKMMMVVPQISVALFAPLLGIMATKLGKLKLLFFSLLLYAMSGFCGYFLPTIYHIIISRAFLGIGIAGILTVATTLIADYFDGPERSSLISMQTVFISIGSTVYGFVAGVLADFSWRNIFVMYLVAIIYFPLAYFFLFNPKSSLTPEQQEKTNRKIVQNNIATICVCFVNFFVFVMFYMIKVQLPYMLYNDPIINFANVPSFVNGFHFVKIPVNAKMVAICLSMETIITTLVALKYSKLKASRDFAVMCAMGFACMAISYLMLTHSVNFWMVLLSMAVCGVGMGMIMPNNTLWVISITKPEKRSFFIGLFNTSSYVGKFMSPFIAMPLLYFVPNNPRMLFQICAFLMLIVAILAMWMNDKFKRINRILYRKEMMQLKSSNDGTSSV